jgi:hypothetical protein
VLQDCVVAGLGPAPEQNESATTLAEFCSTHSTVWLCVPPPQLALHVPNPP